MGGQGKDSGADISCAAGIKDGAAASASTPAIARSVATDALPPITQENLPQALRDGRITQEEVDHVWRETEYLSAQTPIEVRQAIVALKEAGHEVSPVQQIILQTVMDLRAALYRDESKFAHLVAGTETIVGALQNINGMALLVERLETRLDETNLLVNRMVELRTMPSLLRRLWNTIRFIFVGDDTVADEGVGYQPEVEEEYDPMIGSHWDAKNPRKK